MTITLELTKEQEKKLSEMAARKGVRVEVLALAALERSLRDSKEDMDAIIARVVKDNHELYRRLA